MKSFSRLISTLTFTTLLALPAQAVNLKVAFDAGPVSLDPHEHLSNSTLQLSHAAFDPLVRWTRQHSLEPRLAQRWERIDDGTMRFHLRENVVFHSGNELSAEDVVWTFRRLKQSPDFKAIFSSISDVVKIDHLTVDIISEQPNPLVLNEMTYFFPMDSVFYSGQDAKGRDKSALEKYSDTFASKNLSGTGPFTVTKHTPEGSLELARFDSYWDLDSPGNVDSIEFNPIKDDEGRVNALIAGLVDFITPVPPESFDKIDFNGSTKLTSLAGTRIITFQLNQHRREEFQDIRVRQAIVHAIDNRAIVKNIMNGFAVPAGQLSPSGYKGHNYDLPPRYDVDKSRRLMREAGYAEGFKITMMAPNNRYLNDEKIAHAVAEMLSAINIDVDLITLPKAEYWPALDERRADMMMLGWHSATEDSNNFFQFLTACPDEEQGLGHYNSGNYCNSDADDLMQAALTETDDHERAFILQEIESILYKEAAFVPLHWQNLAWASSNTLDVSPIVNSMNFPYLGDLNVEE